MIPIIYTQLFLVAISLLTFTNNNQSTKNVLPSVTAISHEWQHIFSDYIQTRLLIVCSRCKIKESNRLFSSWLNQGIFKLSSLFL